nr:methyltransferase [Nocardioides convexus]
MVDLCCGSGALGLALAHRRPGITLHATDDSPAAVVCAARNLAEVGGTAHLGDLAVPLPVDLRGAVDCLLANVPYVPSAAVEQAAPGVARPRAAQHRRRRDRRSRRPAPGGGAGPGPAAPGWIGALGGVEGAGGRGTGRAGGRRSGCSRRARRRAGRERRQRDSVASVATLSRRADRPSLSTPRPATEISRVARPRASGTQRKRS